PVAAIDTIEDERPVLQDFLMEGGRILRLPSDRSRVEIEIGLRLGYIIPREPVDSELAGERVGRLVAAARDEHLVADLARGDDRRPRDAARAEDQRRAALPRVMVRKRIEDSVHVRVLAAPAAAVEDERVGRARRGDVLRG